MSKIKLNATSGGGSVSLEAPTSTTSNANVELKLPVADGSADQVLSTNGSGQLAFATVGGGGVPIGGIIIWSGAANAIPTGFVLCDGNNSTPDLRDRFVVGAGSTYNVAATGGAATHTLTEAEMPAHNHHVYLATDPNGPYGSIYASGNNNSQGAVATTSKGSGNAHNNLPPYYSLCYIMKT